MSRLKLVGPGAPGSRSRSHRSWIVGALLFAVAGWATLRDADRARHPIAARTMANEALERSLARGSDDAAVRSALVDLRRRLGRHPLDTSARVAYASLLLGLSRTVEETRAAAFHADLASELSPVTVPVVRASAVILARTGNLERSTELIRRMFGYDADSAADLLSTLAPALQRADIERSIASSPDAWIAWLAQLRRSGRDVEANEWLTRAFERWPDHPGTLERMAARCVRQQNWQALSDLFAVEHTLPEHPATARLFAFRALARALDGRRSEALDDAALALRLNENEPRVQISSGDVHAALGRVDQARRLWNRALYALEREDAAATRMHLLLRLARLEDEHGSPAAALRLWRSILEIDGDHPEARRRVEDLTGFSP